MTHTPTAPAVTLRDPAPDTAEIDTLKRLWVMGARHYSPQIMDMLSSVLDGTYTRDVKHLPFQRMNSRERGTMALLYRLTVADRSGKAVGASYIGVPHSWMSRCAEWSTADVCTMASRMNELQMVAVEPRHRRRGIGRMLLHRAEADLRATGHRLMLVCVQRDGDFDKLTAWYRREGFTFGPERGDHGPAPEWLFRPRTDHDRTFPFYRNEMSAAAMGFKALHPAVQVHAATAAAPATVTGLLDEA